MFTNMATVGGIRACVKLLYKGESSIGVSQCVDYSIRVHRLYIKPLIIFQNASIMNHNSGS